MTDLERVKASSPPRPDATCRLLARRGAPLFGFVAYGILYVAVVVNTAVLGALVLALVLLERAGLREWAGADAAILPFTAAVAAVSFWPFIRFVRRRRRCWRELVRDGTLTTGRVTSVNRWSLRGAPMTTGPIAVELDGSTRELRFAFGGHSDELVVGIARPVMADPGSRYAFSFPVPDKPAVAGRWRRPGARRSLAAG